MTFLDQVPEFIAEVSVALRAATGWAPMPGDEERPEMKAYSTVSRGWSFIVVGAPVEGRFIYDGTAVDMRRMIVLRLTPQLAKEGYEKAHGKNSEAEGG